MECHLPISARSVTTNSECGKKPQSEPINRYPGFKLPSVSPQVLDKAATYSPMYGSNTNHAPRFTPRMPPDGKIARPTSVSFLRRDRPVTHSR